MGEDSMGTSPEFAGAKKLAHDGEEIAAIALEHAAERAAREGRLLEPATDWVWMVAPLLTAAWAVVRRAYPDDRAEAQRRYVELLRQHANEVEGAVEG